MIKIPNLNYNEYVTLIGTAHFTRRSINDAYKAVRLKKPTDLALELDWNRYLQLNAACSGCPKRGSCIGLCEFTVGADTLGNVNANIWLIDMSEHEMRRRFRRGMRVSHNPWRGIVVPQVGETPVKLWEMGYKEEVVDYSERQMESLRTASPSIPRVLIDERNALMAGRLAWIVSENLQEGKRSKILAFLGAAHVRGIEKMLTQPSLIKENFRRLNLSFSEPTLIRRIEVREA